LCNSCAIIFKFYRKFYCKFYCSFDQSFKCSLTSPHLVAFSTSNLSPVFHIVVRPIDIGDGVRFCGIYSSISCPGNEANTAPRELLLDAGCCDSDAAQVGHSGQQVTGVILAARRSIPARSHSQRAPVAGGGRSPAMVDPPGPTRSSITIRCACLRCVN